MSRRAPPRYFNSPTAPAPSSSTLASLNRIFDQFRDPSDPTDTIGVNGSMKFLQSIDIGLEEVTVLAIAELLSAPTMGEFSREGFLKGWTTLGCDTIEKMRLKTPSIRASLGDEAIYKRVYLYTFAFARTPGQKSLPLETAVEYWKLLLNRKFKLLDLWIEFLTNVWGKSIAKDTWVCLWDFVKLAEKDPALAGYDVDGAWPSILDDFVEYFRRKNAAGPSMDTS
ncbi:Scaffold-type E3 ligase [Rhizina undulata]